MTFKTAYYKADQIHQMSLNRIFIPELIPNTFITPKFLTAYIQFTLEQASLTILLPLIL